MAHEIDGLQAAFNGGVPVCTEGDTNCDGYDLYKCDGGAWILWERNSTECGYIPNGDEEEGIWDWIKKNALYLGAGGAALAGVGLLLAPKKKK